MVDRTLRRIGILALLGLSNCGYSGSSGLASATPLRQGTDLPHRFEPPAAFPRIAPEDTITGSTCLSPMWDARDNVELTMIRAAEGRADYAVPSGRYGVKKHELLRLDCNTGKPLGVVKK